MATLLVLPVEVRIKIMELVISSSLDYDLGHFIQGWDLPKHFPTPQNPLVPLLQINKQINSEIKRFIPTPRLTLISHYTFDLRLWVNSTSANIKSHFDRIIIIYHDFRLRVNRIDASAMTRTELEEAALTEMRRSTSLDTLFIRGCHFTVPYRAMTFPDAEEASTGDTLVMVMNAQFESRKRDLVLDPKLMLPHQIAERLWERCKRDYLQTITVRKPKAKLGQSF